MKARQARGGRLVPAAGVDASPTGGSLSVSDLGMAVLITACRSLAAMDTGTGSGRTRMARTAEALVVRLRAALYAEALDHGATHAD
jgi:hypothetical protein